MSGEWNRGTGFIEELANPASVPMLSASRRVVAYHGFAPSAPASGASFKYEGHLQLLTGSTYFAPLPFLSRTRD